MINYKFFLFSLSILTKKGIILKEENGYYVLSSEIKFDFYKKAKNQELKIQKILLIKSEYK